MKCIADLHVHVGKAKGMPIKITASSRMTLNNIFNACINRKGVDIVGIVDCASPLVIEELDELLQKGVLEEMASGGYRFRDVLTIILGAEIETSEDKGAAHSIAFFPFIHQMKEFSKIMSKHITNINLSSQRADLNAYNLLQIVMELDGKLIPAHVFTPFKSFYGSCYNQLSDAFKDKMDQIKVIELGLSADTNLADTIAELSKIQFLSNSDAHSVQKIAREYNILELEEPSFKHLFLALTSENEKNKVVGNYGLNPKLGKYHRTLCKNCEYIAIDPPPVNFCPKCGSKNITLGVLDRIVTIADFKKPFHPQRRPKYCHQIPLEFVPGVGKKTLERLISYFNNEINILHNADEKSIAKIAGEKIALNIINARTGKLLIEVGGGGVYGRISR